MSASSTNNGRMEQAIEALLTEENNFDLTVVTKDGTMKVNKYRLSQVGAPMQTMLYGTFNEAGQTTISLPLFTTETITAAVRFTSSGSIPYADLNPRKRSIGGDVHDNEAMTEETLRKLWSLYEFADFYGCEGLNDKILAHLETNTDTHNAHNLFHLLDALNVTDQEDKIIKRIKSKCLTLIEEGIDSIAAGDHPLIHFRGTTMKKIMQSRNLHASEYSIFMILDAWVSCPHLSTAPTEDRVTIAAEMLPHIRLDRIRPDRLKTLHQRPVPIVTEQMIIDALALQCTACMNNQVYGERFLDPRAWASQLRGGRPKKIKVEGELAVAGIYIRGTSDTFWGQLMESNHMRISLKLVKADTDPWYPGKGKSWFFRFVSVRNMEQYDDGSDTESSEYGDIDISTKVNKYNKPAPSESDDWYRDGELVNLTLSYQF